MTDTSMDIHSVPSMLGATCVALGYLIAIGRKLKPLWCRFRSVSSSTLFLGKVITGHWCMYRRVSAGANYMRGFASSLLAGIWWLGTLALCAVFMSVCCWALFYLSWVLLIDLGIASPSPTPFVTLFPCDRHCSHVTFVPIAS